ncbi:hypothetical protein DPMN_001574 [Dreissena polymorpha]|uniref:Uncharacterized protein n=1 Tax=Dreissena polymorpha TaxID=45954 RepID=A0A9D4MIN2_DREPO|nr:hypothetical protein DPMN_001574 [Dreissena polymorpha]
MLTSHNGRRTTDKRRSQKLRSESLDLCSLNTLAATFFNRTIFIHIQNIIHTNILTKKNAPPPGGHVYQATGTIFELVQDIIGKNLLTKFHDDRKINMASRVLTRRPYIVWTNRLTKFYDDWTINVASRVHIGKNAPLNGGHVFRATKTIFELVQDIVGTNLLTKFHEDRKINVASRVINAPPPSHFHEDQTINVTSRVLTRFYYRIY